MEAAKTVGMIGIGIASLFAFNAQAQTSQEVVGMLEAAKKVEVNDNFRDAVANKANTPAIRSNKKNSDARAYSMGNTVHYLVVMGENMSYTISYPSCRVLTDAKTS